MQLLVRALVLIACARELGAAGKGRGRRREQRERGGSGQGPESDWVDPDIHFGALDAKPLAQCSLQLDECRSFVRESVGNGGGGLGANAGTAHALAEVEFVALTRAATDAANASAAASIRSTPDLAAEYEKNGQVRFSLFVPAIFNKICRNCPFPWHFTKK